MIRQSAPVRLYRDPQVFDAERERIFAKTWQFLGLESDLGRPGDYLAETIAGYPIVAAREGGGALRGYHNLCRHRAGPLAPPGRGRLAGEFVCRYHGWRYGLDGVLRAAPGFDPEDGLELSDYPLLPVRTETWRGFVFVNLDFDARPLSEVLAPLDARLGRRSALSARVMDTHTVGCNWKVWVENTLEGYHVEGVHPGLEADIHGGVHEVRIDGEVVSHELEEGRDLAQGIWSWVWPNLELTYYRGVLRLEHMRPLSPDSTLLRHLYLHDPGDPGVDAAHETSERVTHEDAAMCERVQENLDAGVYEVGPLSPAHENAVAWFQERIAQALGAAFGA